MFLLFIGLTEKSYASSYDPGQFSISYDYCAGTVVITWLGYYDCDGSDNDEFCDGHLYVKIGNDAEETIGYFGKGEGTVTAWINGESNYYNYGSDAGRQTVTHWISNSYWMYWQVTYKLYSSDYGKVISARIEGEWDCGSEDIINITKTATATQSGAPTNLSASNNVDCDYVKLNWTNPTDRTCTPSNHVTEIYRDDAYLTSVAYDVTTYNDNTAVKGQDHTYKVRSKLSPTSGQANYSPFSGVVTGKRIGPLPAPSSMAASSDNCEGVVDLTWSWTAGTNPNSFQYQRSSASDFSANLFLSDEIDGDKRVTSDTPPSTNTEYYYRMRSKNECGDWSVWTSSDSGVAPAPPNAPSNVQTSASLVDVTVTWTDNSSVETGFIIERSMFGGGGSTLFNVGANVTSYVDNTVVNCQMYSYEVKAKNSCSLDGVASGTPANAVVVPDLSQTFTNTKLLKASKGYYNDQVKLEWSNNNGSRVEYFKIYRKVYESADDSVLIASQNSSTAVFSDYSAEPGVYYMYYIQAEATCNGDIIKSNISSDIGFKSPTGIVNGHIDYTGGIAVKNAKVLVTKSSGSIGSSLQFDGTNDYTAVPNKPNLNPSAISIEAWVRTSATKSGNYLISKGTAYELLIDNKQPVFKLNNGALNLKFNVDTIEQNNWVHVAATYDGSIAKIYVDGKLKTSQAFTAAIASNSDSLFIGANSAKTNYFAGNIDEIRIWNTARTEEEISRDYGRILNGDETGLVASWGADENVGRYLFDRSKTGNSFNENHGFLRNSPSWSITIPTSSQLGYIGITDENGDYTINGIRYSLAGENFKLTPLLGTHKFTPTNKVVFIGTGSNIHNNMDFEDVSSFTVTGTVRFAQTTCYEEEVILNIDGEAVVKSGELVKTDANGAFTVSVPIGEHFITVTKGGHEFSAGRYPATGFHDFQEPVYGIEFIDTTLRVVTGRVAGGLEQENSSHVPGYGKNNVGQATLFFETQNGCFSKSVTTDANTGQFVIALPPMKYVIPDFFVASNPTIRFEDNDLIDLTQTTSLETEYDTTFVEGSSVISSIDSIQYHKSLDFIYREAPDMLITNKDGSAFNGDSTYVWISSDETDTITVNLYDHPFDYPVFSQYQYYTAKIKLYEKYINKDDGDNWVYDTVPVTAGKLTISNALAEVESKVIELNDADGDTLYTFRVGQPNTTQDLIYPERSYTKVFQVLAETGSHSVEWKPMTPAKGSFFRALVLGAKSSDSQSFVTKGPELVKYVLHDPPGDGSYTFRESGTSDVSYSSWAVGGGLDIHLEKAIKLGTKFSVGLGMVTETSIVNTVTLSLSEESSITGGGLYRSVSTTTERWETSADAENVGAGSDIFIGSSRNMNFGVSNNITLVNKALCETGIDCLNGEIVQGLDTFKIAQMKGFVMVPEDYATTFVYDRNHIENYLIPDLQDIRNQYFTKYPTVYVSKLSADNPNYGKNNDDPVWGSAASSTDYIGTVEADYDGPSYTFNKAAGLNDSIRIYNQQIRLWKEALAADEKIKTEGTLSQNRSFSGGTTQSYTYSHEVTDGSVCEYEITLSEEAKLEIGAEVGGTGMKVEDGIKLKEIVKGDSGSETVTTNTYGYVLHDSNIGDYFSVDVLYKIPTLEEILSGNGATGNDGPIFKLVAGQSMCPNETATYSKYYLPGTLLSAGTLKREVPTISVAPAVKINIPAGQAADFTLTLGNESESDDDMTYDLSVIQSTNPHGAIIKVDGIDPARSLEVPAGSSIQKILTIEKGTGDIYDYDSIAIVLSSPCQSDIVDTAWVSAHFIPTCSDISIISPDNQWVVNNSFNDTLNIILSDYNINYSGLNEIKLWYKPSSQSSWIGLDTWYKDTTGMGNSDLKLIPTNDVYTLYQWNLEQVSDGTYDIKATTGCALAESGSDIFSGMIDRINPHPFGNPSPADDILSPDDEISIQFNEPIDYGLLNNSNFTLTGVLNGTELRHDGFLYFDGVDDNVEIAEGLSLNGSFSMEFWIKRNNFMVTETVISQGINADQSVQIGFNTSNKLTFSVGGNSIASNYTFDNKWHHVVCSYNKTKDIAEIYVDGALDGSETLLTDYTEGGKLYIGKSSVSGSNETFKGYMHEFRVWGKALDLATIVERMNVQLSGNEFNLIGCWQMNEATGTMVEDIARSRNGKINGATWVVDPSGRSLKLDGDGDYLEINSGTYAITEEMDFTVEFWFKGAAPMDTVALFSNGRGDGQCNNPNSWMIFGTPDNHIRVMNDGKVFDAVTTNYFDNTWHHFALSVNRKGNTYAYIDGELQNSMSGKSWLGLGSSRIWIGSRGWFTGMVQHNDKFFNGYVDEVRIWNLARKQEQIYRDRVNRLSGTEIGLLAYYPFELYTKSMGIYTLTESLKNIVDLTVSSKIGNSSYSADVPTIKMERPVENVPFTYSVNNDKIIFTPTVEAYRIENITLDITVKDVKDLQGNTMASPKTWIAFVDQNQVTWQDQELSFRKKINEKLSFQANIINSGGELKTYKIENLPEWLTVDSKTGTLSPDSYKTLNFTVDPSVNIGYYEESISVVTDFGYNEPLLVKLYVYAPAPDWSVDPEKYQFSMNFIAQLKIDGVISSDTADMLGAFVGNQCRGVANLQYVEAYDMYEVFLTVFSNSENGEDIDLKIWDASEGIIHLRITPEYIFGSNAIHGTPSQPVMISTNNTYQMVTQLPKGWKWISFNLASGDMADVNAMLSSVSSQTGDLIKGQTLYDNYSSTIGWQGSLSSGGGFDNKSMYMIKTSVTDSLVYTGAKLNPAELPITINTGWNWIGYTPAVNIEISDALGNYNAADGDLLKSQYAFAMYDGMLGWIGDLKYLKPGLGYMLKTSNGTGTLVYPETGMYKGAQVPADDNVVTVDQWKLEAENYQFNMSLLAQLTFDEGFVTENHVVGAFAGDECRGLAKPTIVNGELLFFVTLYSNLDSETITFKVLDTKTGKLSNAVESVVFKPNSIVGSPSNTYRLSLISQSTSEVVTEATLNVYPNPTKGKVRINFVGSEDLSGSRLEITDFAGKVIYSTLYEGISEFDFSPYGEGIYFMRIISPVRVYMKIVIVD